MSAPVRLQLSRRKGFDLQALSQATNGLPAAKVDRSTGFGNPFPVSKATSSAGDQWVVGTWNGPAMWIKPAKDEATAISVQAFRAWIEHPSQATRLEQARQTLRGKNLACWCRAGDPCHADVLLELANRPVCTPAPGTGEAR